MRKAKHSLPLKFRELALRIGSWLLLNMLKEGPIENENKLTNDTHYRRFIAQT